MNREARIALAFYDIPADLQLFLPDIREDKDSSSHQSATRFPTLVSLIAWRFLRSSEGRKTASSRESGG
jgi:hypothetical protein